MYLKGRVVVDAFFLSVALAAILQSQHDLQIGEPLAHATRESLQDAYIEESRGRCS
jgi:hypothetical protein